jgi:HEPN domain-containing protein
MSITSSQANIIDELFVRTADENYIAARWCAINRLNTDFAWLAVHALEKYLKAVLLYNGKPAKMQGHKIVELYEEVKLLAAPLLPTNLTKPPSLVIGHWFERTPEHFLEHLYTNGNADNRYLIFGHDTRTEDLHMLDFMVFAIRRLICTLEDPIRLHMGGMPSKSAVPTNYEVLLQQPEYRPSHFMPLDDLIRVSGDNASRFAALNLNFAFAPPDFPHTAMKGGDSSRNPVIRMRVLDPMERSDRSQAEEGIETAKWLLDNVRLPGEGKTKSGVAKQIYDAMVDAERRLIAPAP